MTARPYRAAIPFLLVLLVLPACGRRGNPLPPRVTAPAAPGDIMAEVRGNAILVSWTRPTGNQDGSPLRDIQDFRILRGFGPMSGGGIHPLVPLALVRADRPENAQVQEATYIYRDDGGVQGLQPQTRYRYRVEAVNRRGTVGTASGEAVVDFTPAPPAPADLAATPGDGVVDLAWQAPADAAAVTGYNIYRAALPGRFEPQPVNARPVTDTHFRDAGVKNDATYAYVVRSVANARPPWRESADSNAAQVTPQDFIPPAPPRGLVAIAAQGAVGLTWDPNTEPDLLGYFVYRRAAPQVTAERLTETPIPGATFTDRTAPPGATYLYSVTAVDRSAHRNESAPSAEVEAALP
jgi:hypothetical protein